ncbi:MAG TPA: hypothetical protein PLD54_03505 [Candidatus Levybacteria bacterium]|nr:hypothetical protein [Candidatus Levybacteria bacterium]
MVKKSRAGTIFSRRDGASQKKRGTIFEGDQKQNDHNGKNGLKPMPIMTDTPPPQEEGRSAPAIQLTQLSRTLEEISKTSARVIYRIKTIFPFVLFPDEIVADEEKVSVVIGNFYKSGYLRSVMIRDISTISIDTSLLFACMTIIDRNYIQDALVVQFLKKDEAFKMRRVLMGLVISDQNKVDLSAYSTDELCKHLERIGASRSEDTYNI